MYILTLLTLVACQTEAEKESIDQLWAAAPLTELSGDCPEIESSDINYSIESSGETRTFRALYPENGEGPFGLFFFYHGFMDTDPVGYWSNAVGLQSVSNDLNVVIILPQSNQWNLLGQLIYMWDVETGTTKMKEDLQFFDDLRSCATQNFDIDLDRLTTMGVSGGALFSTVLLSHRADSIAAAVQFSGGSDIEVPSFTGLFSEYETPAYTVPSLLITGGEQDLWPNASLPIVNFHEATNTLQSQLVSDGHLTVRCQNNLGHIPMTGEALLMGWDWVSDHRYEEASPYETGINGWDHWCERIE